MYVILQDVLPQSQAEYKNTSNINCIYRTKKGVEGYEQKDYQSHTHVYYDRRAHVYEHAGRKSQ